MSDHDIVAIRVSALNFWPDCERRSAAGLFRREIRAAGYTLTDMPRSAGAAVGTSVHHAAKVTLDEKAKTGLLPPLSVATDAAVETLKEETARGVSYDSKGPTYNRQDAEAQVIRMARVYQADIAPTINPILVEERLTAQVSESIVLTGQPDVVAREPGSINDLNTGIRVSNKTAQLGGYSLLARTPRPEHPEGLKIERARIDYIPRVSLRKPQPAASGISRDVVLAETAAVNIIANIERGITTFRRGSDDRRIQPGDPWAFSANPNSMLCSAKYCPAYGLKGPHSFCNEWLDRNNTEE